MREKTVQDKIQLALARTFQIRTFDNINGKPVFGKMLKPRDGIVPVLGGRPKRVGWGDGSPDLVGWHSVVVTPAMVGKRLAVLVGIEVKRPGEIPTPEQFEWLALLMDQGAIAGWTNSDDGAIEIVHRWEKQCKQ